jgi:hypothetical protein
MHLLTVEKIDFKDRRLVKVIFFVVVDYTLILIDK